MKFVSPGLRPERLPWAPGNNLALRLEAGGLYTFRALIRPLRPGRMNWRFFYWNQVDSTWDDGSQSRAGLPAGAFASSVPGPGCVRTRRPRFRARGGCALRAGNRGTWNGRPGILRPRGAELSGRRLYRLQLVP